MKNRKPRTKSKAFTAIKKLLPYVGVLAIVIGVMVIGSRKEQGVAATSTVLNVFGDSNFVVTTDQLSESFIVAETAKSFNLPSANTIAENYVSVAMRYATTGALETTTIEKPNIVDTSNLARGVITYTVKEGDDLIDIAVRYNVTANQIRWSNNMKTNTLSAGQTLYIPSVPGILYTVKEGDTVDGLAEKYKSSSAKIITFNDLEASELEVGKTIILPDGELPETERPEYVAPVSRPSAPSYSYSSYLTDSGTRHNIREIGSRSYWIGRTNATRGDGNTGSGGQCTWFAWHWRRYNMGANYWLPSGVIGNARDWVRRLSSSYYINRTPAYGAVIQTSTSYYGHVGVVTGVVPGKYITVQEMNYYSISYRVIESEIYWADALKYNYIHGHK